MMKRNEKQFKNNKDSKRDPPEWVKSENSKMDNDILTTIEAADLLKVTPRRIQQYCKANMLGHKQGGRYVITRGDIRSFWDKYANMKPGRKPKQPQKQMAVCLE
jgi:hypothetical protein